MQYGLPNQQATVPLNIGTTHITNLDANPPTQHSTTSEDSDDGTSLHLVSFFKKNNVVIGIK